jgi:hypothetical protein
MCILFCESGHSPRFTKNITQRRFIGLLGFEFLTPTRLFDRLRPSLVSISVIPIYDCFEFNLYLVLVTWLLVIVSDFDIRISYLLWR